MPKKYVLLTLTKLKLPSEHTAFASAVLPVPAAPYLEQKTKMFRGLGTTMTRALINKTNTWCKPIVAQTEMRLLGALRLDDIWTHPHACDVASHVSPTSFLSPTSFS